jgi:hypothetical protein
MEQIEIFRRKRGSSGQWKCHAKPYIKLELPRGQFVVFAKTMKVLNFNHNEAVMFGFNRKEKTGYIFKEEPQEDSYYLRYNQRDYSRFTSKELMLFMKDIFEFEMSDKAVYFELETTPNEKGQFRFHLDQ